MVRVVANSLGNQGSIPGQVIPKTKKMVRDPSLLNTQYYKVRIKGKWNIPTKEVGHTPTPLSHPQLCSVNYFIYSYFWFQNSTAVVW